MDKLISTYLFQSKTCPLPGLGTFTIETGNAQTDFLNKQMLPPKPEIYFKANETPADAFVDFIAASNGIPPMQAIEELANYCNQLKRELNAGTDATINTVGKLFLDSTGGIHFTPTKLQSAFLMPVATERVIHPNAEHTILVGDKETTSATTEAYYGEPEVRKNYWWVWAIIITIVSIALILYYVNMTNSTPSFGNTSSFVI